MVDLASRLIHRKQANTVHVTIGKYTFSRLFKPRVTVCTLHLNNLGCYFCFVLELLEHSILYGLKHS